MIMLFHVSCNSGSHLGFDSLIFNFSCSKCSLWLPLIIIIIIWGWGVPVVVTLKLKFVCVCVCVGGGGGGGALSKVSFITFWFLSLLS